MKNKILLTTAMALIGLLSLSTVAEAHRGNRGRGRHKHVTYHRGNRVVVWHNNFNQCGNRWGYNNFRRGNRMCGHMRGIYRGGRCGNAIIRCNSRGCNMFGMSYRNGRFFNSRRGHGHFNNRGNWGNGRNNRGRGGNRNGRRGR